MDLQAIYPANPQVTLPKACVGCKGDVNTNLGFADMAAEPWTTYYCRRCTSLTLSFSQMVDAYYKRDVRELASKALSN